MMRWSTRRDPDPPHRAAHASEPTALAAMSPALLRLVVLAEDSRFRQHWGVDLVELRAALDVTPGAGPAALLRTLWQRRRQIRGASTITQQLAKNLYLSPSRNPLRKIKEAVTAVRLEAALSKDRILELYLNTVELGPDLWGVPAASRTYFGVDPDQLTIEQAASLAATLPHPRTSNPAYRPARMLARRHLILLRFYGADTTVIPSPDWLDADSLVPVPFHPPVIPPGLDTLSVIVPIDSAAPDSGSPGTRPPP